jgi:DNA polymerase-3 subunit alpha
LRRCSRAPLRRGQPPRRRGEEAAEGALLDLAYALDLPLVATNPALYADRSFHAAHDAMLCIANSAPMSTSADRPSSSEHAWLKGEAEMAALFADLPEALANTAGRRPPLRRRRAQAPPDPAAHGRRRGRALRRRPRRPGEADRRGRYAEEQKPAYRERLDFELDVIIRMGFAGYFLIVADFIKWAKANDIPVGPGRGSGAGSAVAWALTITDLDPIALGLLFERFLNPERVSMPDFDIDFCETHRDKVIRYVQEQIRPGPGGADHHLRAAEGARGAQGHGPRAADELRPGRPAGQARAQPPDRSVDAGAIS